ncbi:MAG: hypothetical protein PF482_05710 [Desulfobacteraceae bacterium]|nr:hypothetical protein [Desulfobacteraceae bacterium]
MTIVSAKADLSFPNVSIGEACRNDIVLAETMTKAVTDKSVGGLAGVGLKYVYGLRISGKKSEVLFPEDFCLIAYTHKVKCMALVWKITDSVLDVFPIRDISDYLTAPFSAALTGRI